MRLSRFGPSAGKPELGASGWASRGPQSRGRAKGVLVGDQQATELSLEGAELGAGEGHELSTYYVLGETLLQRDPSSALMGSREHRCL